MDVALNYSLYGPSVDSKNSNEKDSLLNIEFKDLIINEGIRNDITLNMQKKRSNYLSWEDYFMATAVLSSNRSKDPKTQVGACIVNKERKIVGIGYNGMPKGCDDDDLPWGKNPLNPLADKHLYVCHAEMNAILNKNASDVENCTLYVTLFPCCQCAKLIIQAGIKEIVYMNEKCEDRPEYKASRLMFKMANIKLRKFEPQTEQVTINLKQTTLEI